MKRILISILMAMLPLGAWAQFYVTGDDPGRLRWYSIDTDNFRIIYPEGNDSLAKVYGGNLEKYRIPVSRTSGYLPGGPGKQRMPVVLHTWNTSNGSVAWAPKRMDLFTIPSAYDPEPIPWDQMLAVHESRHVSQMQFGMTSAMKPFNWFFGEMFNILVSILYPNISNMEGDAVITETAYSNSGRGRTSDFLNYYRVAADNGLKRSWNQWRFPSQKNYSPTYYALGYMTVGGIRHFYDFPDYMDQAYHLVAKKPYKFMGFRTLAKEAAGKKKFSEVFEEITDTMAVIWKAEADARAPYIPMEAVTPEPRLYTNYTSNVFIGNDLYSLKQGHLNTTTLVRTTDEGEKRVASFSAQTGKIHHHGDRIYWSETIPDERWSMQTHSKIRSMKGSLSTTGEPVWTAGKTLSKGGRLLHNPSPSEDGKVLACVEYMIKGGSALVITDAADGKVLGSSSAPDGVQLVETAWIGNEIYATGINEGGYGIYRVGRMSDAGLEGLWEEVLKAEPVMVKDFGSYKDELMFTCDRTGVNELYHLDPQSGRLIRKTSIRHGGESFAYSPDGKWLYFSSLTLKGKQVFRTPVEELLDSEEDYGQRHRYLLAESLTKQENMIAARERTVCPEEGTQTDEPVYSGGFSEPERYRKFPHAFNVHSWAPVYVSVDNIMNTSFDYIYEAASLGATGIIQNRLSNAVGEFGYSAHKDPYRPDEWRHSGHAKFTYSGFYPVFEAKVDFNDRAARQYNMTGYLLDNSSMIALNSRNLSTPSLHASIKTWIPFNLSSGGWYRGIIPQVTYTVSNDFMNNSMSVVSQRTEDGFDAMGRNIFISAEQKGNHIMQYLSGSIRMYTMLGTSNSCVYPRWGVGLEVGGWANLNAPEYFSPMGYAYLYGYMPGFMRSHGIKLSATYQTRLSDSPFGQRVVNVLPRGLKNNGALGSSLATRSNSMMLLSADYGIPVYIGDVSVLSNFLYIKRLVLTPHFDYALINMPASGKDKSGNIGSLWSAGCTLALGLESVAWISWPCTIGVTGSYNGGASAEEFNASKWFVGPVFSVTF